MTQAFGERQLEASYRKEKRKEFLKEAKKYGRKTFQRKILIRAVSETEYLYTIIYFNKNLKNPVHIATGMIGNWVHTKDVLDGQEAEELYERRLATGYVSCSYKKWHDGFNLIRHCNSNYYNKEASMAALRNYYNSLTKK